MNLLVFKHLSCQASSFLITNLAFELSFCSVLQKLFPGQQQGTSIGVAVISNCDSFPLNTPLKTLDATHLMLLPKH